MPISTFNGIRLFWEQHGSDGAPVAFVHGSWGDHHNWDAVVGAFARTFRVFTYDRRGHSQSERPTGQGRIEEDVADLAAFIRGLNVTPAHVVGNSGGAVVALKLATIQPDLFASLVVHEPPFIGMIQDHPMMPAVRDRLRTVTELLRGGDMEAGAREFVETIAFGPGMWETLSPEMRQTFIFNAPTFLDEMDEPLSVMTVDLQGLARFAHPILLTRGNRSAPFFSAILNRIAAVLPAARRHTFEDAGHVPHLTHPDEYARVVMGFIDAVEVSRA
jgi:pimeloyl-ACP methyl ester carboxylesterase